MDDDVKVSDDQEITDSSTEASDDIGEAEQTATASSGGDESTETEASAESTTTEAEVEDNVPYSRFKQVIEERNELKRRVEGGQVASQATMQQPQVPSVDNAQMEQIKAQLKSLGFITKEEQEAELQRVNQDIAVENQLSSLSQTYNGKDGRPKFNREKVLEYAINHQIADIEVAYKQLNEKALIDWHIQQATSGKKAIKSEASDGSGSSQSGTTDEDLKEAVSKGNKSALSAYLKRRIRAAQAR